MEGIEPDIVLCLGFAGADMVEGVEITKQTSVRLYIPPDKRSNPRPESAGDSTLLLSLGFLIRVTLPTMTDTLISTHVNFPALASHERYIQRIRELASTTLPDSDALLTEGGTLFAQLKAINRATNVATRDHKQHTAEARQAMDHTHLGLQNLMYERRHFEKEIEKCRQFA